MLSFFKKRHAWKGVVLVSLDTRQRVKTSKRNRTDGAIIKGYLDMKCVDQRWIDHNIGHAST